MINRCCTKNKDLISFLLGLSVVVGGSATHVYLTHLVGRKHLMDAQSLFTATDSVARIVGPGIAGILINWLTAPIAL